MSTSMSMFVVDGSPPVTAYMLIMALRVAGYRYKRRPVIANRRGGQVSGGGLESPVEVLRQRGHRVQELTWATWAEYTAWKEGA